MNAEIAGGSVKNAADAVNFLTWTFMWRRLVQNPSFYGLEDTSDGGVADFLLNLFQSKTFDQTGFISDCISCDDERAFPKKGMVPNPGKTACIIPPWETKESCKLINRHLRIVYSTTMNMMEFMHTDLQYICTEKQLRCTQMDNLVFVHTILVK